MKSIFYLTLLVIAACGAKNSSVDYGQTTVANLIAEKGEPLKEDSVPVADNKVLVYPDNEKYQVKGDIVTHGFKEPKGEGKTLLYWKHAFKDCETVTKKLAEPKGHERAEYELACPSEGKSVIYSEGSEFISRVIEYAKK